MTTWPVQSKCPQFYGDIQKISNQLVLVKCPWVIRFNGNVVNGITIHKKCAASLERILKAIWLRLGEDQVEIDRIGMSKFSGSYNPRKIAGSNAWSMHAYGCAVDFDSANNWLGDTTPAMDRRVIEEFEREGWEWGGHWKKPDGMHFQAAWTRINPPRLGALTVQPKVTTKQLAKVSKKVSFLQSLQKWFVSIGTAASGVFTIDSLGLFQGWIGVFSGLGKIALTVAACVFVYLFVQAVLIEMIKKDHEEGRWTPSGAVDQAPVQENTDGVAATT